MKEQSRLKLLREEKKLTQEQLAKILDISRTSICEWEVDIFSMKLKVAIKIADYFDVPLDFLVGRIARSQKKEMVELLKTANYEEIVNLLTKKKNK